LKRELPLCFFAGVDRGGEKHVVHVLDQTGKQVVEFEIVHSGAQQLELADRLQRTCGDPAQLGVALEAPHGAVVEHLLERGFAVYAINPKQLDRFRDRHSPAGAKDDSRDARVLAGALRTDPDSFRLLEAENPQTIELRELSRLDASLKRDFRRASNQLWEQMYRYYPQMLALSPAVDEPWVWALIKKAPLPAAGAKLTPGNIRHLLAAHRIRRITAEEVVAALRTTPLQVAPGTAEAASRHALTLVPRLELLFRQIQETGQSIESMLEAMASDETETNGKHRDAAILLSLPGIGPVTGATMLAEAAEPLRQRDYHALRCYAGTAPITRQSGKRRTVVMRRGCSPRLREALFHSVSCHVQWDPHSQAQYDKLRAAGHGHARAVRGVADRFLHLMVVLLKNGTLYDPQRRVAAQTIGAGCLSSKP
jgi:transposase